MNPLSEKQRKALDVRRNLAITAGAGSGKTTVLVHRFLNILLHHPQLSVSNVLAITFTDKATAEMKGRIFDLLEKQFRENRSQQARIFEILTQMHEAQIFTIHAFCSHVIRQYPVESGQNPDFTIIQDIQIDDVLNQVFREFMISYDKKKNPDASSIMAALREFPLKKLRYFLSFIYQKRATIFKFLDVYQSSSPEEIFQGWKNMFLDHHRDLLKPLLEEDSFWSLLKILIEIDLPEDSKALPNQLRLQEYYLQYSTAQPEEFSRFQALINILTLVVKSDGTAYSNPPGGRKSWGEDGVDHFKKLSDIASVWFPGVIPFDEPLEEIYANIQFGLSQIFLELLNRIEQAKIATNVLDFEDLQILTLNLLNRYPEIRDQLRRQYQFILVDEFQDTDHLQSSIIRLLTHDHSGKLDTNRLFLVGDPKQSIYGFRSADVSLFKEYLNEISQQDSIKIPLHIDGESRSLPASRQELQGIIQLAQNYRSSPVLIHFFNRAFESIFTQDSEFDVDFQKLESGREEFSEQNSFIRLDVMIDGSESGFESEKLHAVRMADIIREFGTGGQYQKLVFREDSFHLEPISFGDIAVLIRSRTHLPLFEQTFRRANIPYLTYKGTGFFQKPETQEFYYFLHSTTHPEDNFALITVLRSAFVGLSDVTLFYLTQILGRNYWEKIQKLAVYFSHPEQFQKIFNQDFVDFTQDTGQAPQFHPGEEEAVVNIVQRYKEWIPLALNGQYSLLIDDIIEKLQVRPLLRLHLDGQQKLANLEKLVDYIFEFEQNPAGNSADLLETLRRQISGEVREGQAVIMAGDEDKVKILTFHSAKGMEFPVVLLPLLEKPFRYNQQILIDNTFGMAFNLDRSSKDKKSFAYQKVRLQDHKKIRAEEKRLLYVATTRARDFLLMSGVIRAGSSPPQPSYLAWLLESLQIPKVYLENGEPLNSLEPFPGTRLNLETIKEMPNDPSVSASGPNQQGKISSEHFQLLSPLTERPGNQVYSVTQLMLFREDPQRYFHHYYLNDGIIAPVTIRDDYPDQPGGEKWGSLVHELLENFYLRSPEEDQRRIKQLMARYSTTAEENIQEQTQKLHSVLSNIRKNPLARNLKPGKVFSEFSISMRLDNFILRGTFDLLHQNAQETWEILDYKTNRITGGQVERVARKYEFQAQAYAFLLSGLYPDQNIIPITLYFLEPGKLYRREYNRLEIESIKIEIHTLLTEIFQYELSLFHVPGSPEPSK